MTEPSVTAEVLAGFGLSMAQAARRVSLGRDDKPTSPSTIFRWSRDGVRLPDGSRLYLEAVRLGGRWLTSGPALERFIARQTPPPEAASAPTPRTAQERDRAAQRAGRDLDQLGL
jgi:hypothetical protein